MKPRHRAPNGVSAVEKFRLKIEMADTGCWLWKAGVNLAGPQMRFPDTGKASAVWPWAYSAFVGAIPRMYKPRPSCGAERCVNPAHLHLVACETTRVKDLLGYFRALYLVDEGTGCWVWQGHLRSGYGRIKINGKSVSAHRWSYENVGGNPPIAAGLQIDHLCRRRSCVNPAHLEAVTPKVNILRGEGTGAIFARRSACKYGTRLRRAAFQRGRPEPAGIRDPPPRARGGDRLSTVTSRP